MRTFCVSVITVALLAGSAIAVTGQQEDPPSRPPIPSAGCGVADIEPGRLTGETGFEWQLFVPDAHDGTTPIPLVISLHGGSESSTFGYNRFTSVAAEEGFTVLAPGHDRQGAWMWWPAESTIDPEPSNPDVARVGAMLDELAERLCLDLARVYAAGFSGGALGSYILGCAWEDRIAAVAPVAALVGPRAPCPLDRPMPVIAVHGTADDTALFDGWIGDWWLDSADPESGAPMRDTPLIEADGFDFTLSVPERAAGIAAHNGCEPEPMIEALGEAERYVWSCPEGADVELIAHRGGHVWRSTTDGRSTEELIWEFFEQHPMPE